LLKLFEEASKMKMGITSNVGKSEAYAIVPQCFNSMQCATSTERVEVQYA